MHNDFSVKLVAGHSNSALPVYFRVAAAWGNHEGSLLFWVFVLSIWTVAVAACRQLAAASLRRARAGRAGRDQRGLPAVLAGHVESL